MNSSPDLEKKKKCVQNFRTLTIASKSQDFGTCAEVASKDLISMLYHSFTKAFLAQQIQSLEEVSTKNQNQANFKS